MIRAALTLALLAMTLPAQTRLVEGRADSAVRVIVYESLQCGDCTAFRKMMDERLLPRYGGRVAFEHRDFPLAKQAWSRPAAVASQHFQTISAELALAWRRHALTSLRTINAENFEQHLRAFATAQKAGADAAVAALADEKLIALVERDSAEGVARGIARTPTALVNGRPFIEKFTFEEIAAAIDEALAAEGTP
jgi:protein-disulfide isomerase